MKKNQVKTFSILSVALLAVVGTYNALMIGSGSHISAQSSHKRLEETLGVVKAGRSLAVSSNWEKVEKNEVVVAEVKSAPAIQNTASEATIVEAAIDAALDMKLVEVSNLKLWKNGVNTTDYSGAVVTNNGVIENLTASLPGGHSLEISFSEMAGNTFEYDLNGEVYSALMYQVDQNAYVVSLTNGPLEGTKMRFAGEAKDVVSTETFLAENHNMNIGNFGEELDYHQTTTETTEVAQVNDASFTF